MSVALAQHNGSHLAVVREFLSTKQAFFTLPDIHSQVATAVGQLNLLLGEDREYLDRWTVEDPYTREKPGDPDDGLIRKERQRDGYSDNKWFFHYRPSLTRLLLQKGVAPGKYRGLLEACHHVWTRCYEWITAFCDEFDCVDTRFSLGERIRTDPARRKCVFRILRYDAGTEIGKKHTDRCGLTMHLAEKRPGLYMGSDTRVYAPACDQVCLFPSDGFTRLTNGEYPALTHSIMDSVPNVMGDERWAGVFFVKLGVGT